MNARIEPPLSPTWLRIASIAALGLVLSLWVWTAIYAHAPGTDGGDGPFFFRLIEASKIGVGRWHELPLWNPYECGGVPLWDNPQSIAASPVILLFQPFSTTITMGAWVILHVTAGFVGTWLLCRDELKLSRIATFTGACLFAFSAPLCNHLAGGHTAFGTFELAPLALYFWRRAESDHRQAIGLGLLVADILYSGGVYTLANLGLMLLIETTTRIDSGRRFVALARAALIVGLVAGMVSAGRLLPVLDQLAHHSRGLAPESDFIDWQLLKDMYLDRSHALRFGHEYVWGEYVAYCGPIVLLLAFVGLILSVRDRTWMLVVGTALFLLMLGHFARWAPWSLLKNHVPPFISMRVPARFRLLLVLFIASWVAIAVDRLPRLIERVAGGVPLARAARTIVVGAALFATGDVASTAIDNIIAPQWNGPPPAHVVPGPRLFLGGPGMAQFIDQPRQNRGRLECWEEWVPNTPTALWTGDLPQAKALRADASITGVVRTQSSFRVVVDAAAPTTLLFNTSFARGWRTNVGTARVEGGQLAVDIPAGHHEMKVWYWPVGLTAGLALTLVGLIASILVLHRKKTA